MGSEEGFIFIVISVDLGSKDCNFGEVLRFSLFLKILFLDVHQMLSRYQV